MPRRIPIGEARKWLEDYESGRPEDSIARDAHRDVRTIKKGIEQAYRHLDVRRARSELLKEALRKHHVELLKIVNGILGNLELPQPDLELGSGATDGAVSRRIGGATIRYEATVGWTWVIDVQDEPHWELLKEHLGRDAMWRAVARWQQMLASHLDDRVTLRRRTIDLLQEKTGLRVAGSGKHRVDPLAVRLACEAALDRAMRLPERRDLERAVVSMTRGEVLYLNTAIASTREGGEGECRDRILEAVRELLASDETAMTRHSCEQAREALGQARTAVQEVALLGLIPGQSRVCRRLGF